MKTVLLAALVLAPLSGACLTDGAMTTDRELRIGEAPSAAADPAWSYTEGTAAVVAPGALTLPERVAIRIDVLHDVDGRRLVDAVAMGTVEIIGGSACRLVAAARCDGTACVAEVELTAPGVCMVRARVGTPDGEELGGCWHRARWEGEADDATLRDELALMADNQQASCEASL